jgi:hypothetical protein
MRETAERCAQGGETRFAARSSRICPLCASPAREQGGAVFALRVQKEKEIWPY